MENEVYDFTYLSEYGDEVATLVDKMNFKQLKAIKEAAQEIAEDCQKESQKSHRDWFDLAIKPALIEFAQLNAVSLQIGQPEGDRHIVASFWVKNGLDFSAESRTMYMALMLASHIEISRIDDMIVTEFIYDCDKFI